MKKEQGSEEIYLQAAYNDAMLPSLKPSTACAPRPQPRHDVIVAKRAAICGEANATQMANVISGVSEQNLVDNRRRYHHSESKEGPQQ